MILTADHVGYLHIDIVHHGGEIVGGGAVGAREDVVVHDLGGEHGLAPYRVVHDYVAMIFGDGQPPDVWLTGRDALRDGGLVQVATGPVIPARALSSRGLLALGGQFFGGAEAGVGGAVRLHSLQRGGVAIRPLGLEVGAEIAAHFGTLVPVKPQPLERPQDLLRVGLGGALGIGVVDAQDEGASRAASESPVVDSCAGAADVQGAGGAGGETYAYGISHGATIASTAPC